MSEGKVRNDGMTPLVVERSGIISSYRSQRYGKLSKEPALEASQSMCEPSLSVRGVQLIKNTIKLQCTIVQTAA